jgi:hypothetical protein
MTDPVGITPEMAEKLDIVWDNLERAISNVFGSVEDTAVLRFFATEADATVTVRLQAQEWLEARLKRAANQAKATGKDKKGAPKK